jgi:hypothetical protein
MVDRRRLPLFSRGATDRSDEPNKELARGSRLEHMCDQPERCFRDWLAREGSAHRRRTQPRLLGEVERAHPADGELIPQAVGIDEHAHGRACGPGGAAVLDRAAVRVAQEGPGHAGAREGWRGVRCPPGGMRRLWNPEDSSSRKGSKGTALLAVRVGRSTRLVAASGREDIVARDRSPKPLACARL